MGSSLLPGAEPFFFRSASKASAAVLVLHGFTSACHSMRALGRAIADSGFDAQGILLPGHGTSPEDLEKTDWHDWYRAVEDAFVNLRAGYARVFIVGQSMGGCLGLLLATFRSVDGVVTLSSGLKIFNPALWFLPIVRHFVRFKRKEQGPDAKDPEVKMTEVHYELMPYRSIDQLQRLLAELRRRIHLVECPVLTMHGREDHTFAFRNQAMIMSGIRSSLKKSIVLENTYHLATLDYDKALVEKETISFLRSL